MADKTIDIKVNINPQVNPNGSKSVDDLKNSIKNVESATKESQERMLKMGDNVSKVAAGMTDAFVGFYLALGATSEEADKVNKKFETAIGISMGVKGGIEAMVGALELAGPAFKALNTIIAANPIAATVIAVAALTAGIYLLVKAMNDEVVASEAVAESIRKNRDAHIENEKQLKILAIERRVRNEEIDEAEGERQKVSLDTSEKIYKNQIARNAAITKLEKEAGFKRGETSEKYQYEELNKWLRFQTNLKKINDDFDKLNLEAGAESNAKKLKITEEAKDNEIKKIGETEKEKKEKLLAFLTKQLEESRALYFLNQKYMAEEGLKINTDTGLKNVELEKQIADLTKQIRIDNELETSLALRAMRIADLKDGLEIAKNGTQAIAGLSDGLFAIKISNLEKGSKAEQKAMVNQFKVAKALNLSMATITGVQSVMAAFANGMKNPVPLLGPATAGVYAGIAAAASLANIAKIAATKFDGGSSSSPSISAPSTASSDSLASSSNAIQAMEGPSLNKIGRTGAEIQADASGTSKRLSNQPIKAYVVSQEVTSSQNAEAVISRRSSF